MRGLLTQTSSPALRPGTTWHMCVGQSARIQRAKNQADGEAMVRREERKGSPPKPSAFGFSQTGRPGPLAPAKRVCTSRLGPPSHTKILKNKNKKTPNPTIIVLLSRAKNLSFCKNKIFLFVTKRSLTHSLFFLYTSVPSSTMKGLGLQGDPTSPF